MPLFSDAVHTAHPLAGLGLNIGFEDVELLNIELAKSLRAGVDIGISMQSIPAQVSYTY